MMTEERSAVMTELGRTEERLRSLQQEIRELVTCVYTQYHCHCSGDIPIIKTP